MSARAGWVDSRGKPTAFAPWWLLCPVGDYPGLNKVAFWAPEWKQHLLTELDYAITVGANGVFLDEFDGTAYRLTNDPDCARIVPPGIDLEGEMIQLLREIRGHIDAKGLGRPFWIVVSDGRAIFWRYPDLIPLIDGSLAEHSFFVGWNLPDFMNGPEQEWRTQESSEFIAAMVAAGRPVFTLDYVTDPTKIARVAQLASALRFTPAVSEHKILTISKPRNVMWCDRFQCSNNGVLLAGRDLRLPIEEIFFDLLEIRFPELFYPAWRISRQYADEHASYVYRYYPATVKYVGYRQADRGAFYYDPVQDVVFAEGTVDFWVNVLTAP